MSDNRQIILVNLADKEQPQMILQMSEQIIGMSAIEGGHKINILALESDSKLNCYQLIKRQPLKKEKPKDASNFILHFSESIDKESAELKNRINFDF